ncbi:hypothetical protein ACP3TJ_02160 [Desulforudis sp. 1088]|uniref:hypothetical protein n=1 Tax=unclassified Candidatus Desulforudis TaxID=2635950 RepID=UPI0034709100
MACGDCKHFMAHAPFSHGRGTCGTAEVAVDSSTYNARECPYNAFLPREEGLYEEW